MPAPTAMNVLTLQEKEFLRQINTPAAQSSKPNTLFEKQDIVGKGAYGAVYKGKHRETNQVVALKIINLDTADDDVEDIQKEVALLKRLMAQGSLANEENGASSKQKGKDGDEELYGVPNVIKYYGCWTEGPKVWIVMELAEGGSVRTLARASPMTELQICLTAREVLNALAFLHKNGIIHRDIKGKMAKSRFPLSSRTKPHILS
ncbi:hypothetical protein QFC22_001977 [Naganishia vaughanmartiniae]|uniref:Uncharacterized protein n=1 Tax=Naganishia vaughanmartiniae TaxID=1424756 RepID=A0ACC2XFF0_9TREE|nr:hypothetical protein QFC22_001977 [Naganishia vaughanmartiniae]